MDIRQSRNLKLANMMEIALKIFTQWVLRHSGWPFYTFLLRSSVAISPWGNAKTLRQWGLAGSGLRLSLEFRLGPGKEGLALWSSRLAKGLCRSGGLSAQFPRFEKESVIFNFHSFHWESRSVVVLWVPKTSISSRFPGAETGFRDASKPLSLELRRESWDLRWTDHRSGQSSHGRPAPWCQGGHCSHWHVGKFDLCQCWLQKGDLVPSFSITFV